MKTWKPWQNLRFRLVAWYSLLAGLSMLISDRFIYHEFQRTLLGQVDGALKVNAIQALKNLDDEVNALVFDPRKDAPIIASLLSDAGVVIFLLGNDGTVKERFGDSLIFPSRQDVKPGFETVQTGNGRWRTYTKEVVTRRGRPSGWLKVARSLQPIDTTLQNLSNQYLLKLPILLGMVGLGGYFLASRALKPIAQITETSKQIRVSGDLTQRIHYRGTSNDELARLALMFDEMMDSLQSAFEFEKRFLADASHELRTPLTTLKGRLQVTLRQTRSIAAYQEALHWIDHDVDRLIRLSSDLLLLSRLEQNHHYGDRDLIDLSDLLAAVAVQAQPLADLRHLSFSTSIDPGLLIQGSPDHLIRLFLNLLDNAIKHTPAPGSISLVAAAQIDCIRVDISDTGVGIAPEHMPHLFERFYRVEKSRSRATGGTGLGLAIAQEIVHRHHGTISVQSEPGRGTTLTVSFPR
jgi:heavy metal sensor kinase